MADLTVNDVIGKLVDAADLHPAEKERYHGVLRGEDPGDLTPDPREVERQALKARLAELDS